MFKKNFLKKCNGTTLIELMVVITILSIVTLGLVSFFGGGMRSWISGQNQLKAQREARMALDRIVKDIREANMVVEGNNSYEKGIEVSFPKAFNRANLIYNFDEPNGVIKRDNANILIENIPFNGFVISYFDINGNPATYDKSASKIEVMLKVDVDGDERDDIELKTEVNLRNYGRL